MHHELEARTRQALEEEIETLKKHLKYMASDFAECARTGKSPCFFCANDATCMCTNDADCRFKWQPHN